MMQRIGMIGVGRMGANMARRLKECGFTITAIYDVLPNVAASLAEELRAEACHTLSEVTRLSDAIITVVSDDQAMRDVYLNPADNLLTAAKGKLFINCATVSPGVHIELAQKATEAGAYMLEAPMASSIPQARAGTLFMMCAGGRQTFETAQPILNALTAEVIYTGAPGTAASLKLLVNMVMNINTAALAEGLGLAEAVDLDLNLVRQVFAKTGANSRVLETDGEDMQNREHETYFSAAHAAKDSGLAVALGKSAELPMVLATATEQQYQRMIEKGLGDLDKSGISELTFKSRMTGTAAPV